mgnify:CR=1 FL=1
MTHSEKGSFKDKDGQFKKDVFMKNLGKRLADMIIARERFNLVQLEVNFAKERMDILGVTKENSMALKIAEKNLKAAFEDLLMKEAAVKKNLLTKDSANALGLNSSKDMQVLKQKESALKVEALGAKNIRDSLLKLMGQDAKKLNITEQVKLAEAILKTLSRPHFSLKLKTNLSTSSK